MKKLYSFDNFQGDKGIIIADSLAEAHSLYRKEYPKHKIANNQDEYFDNGCYINEELDIDGKRGLFNIFPW